MLAGLLLALPAMLAGLVDMKNIEAQSRAIDIVNQHMVFVMMSWSLYALSLFARMEGTAINTPNFIAVVLSLIGFVVLAIAGWLGGKMVYEFGVGVDPLHIGIKTEAHDENA